MDASAFWAQGPWAVLFVSLLLLYIKQSNKREDFMVSQHEKREERLIEAIEKLSATYESLDDSYKSVATDIAHINLKLEIGGNRQ